MSVAAGSYVGIGSGLEPGPFDSSSPPAYFPCGCGIENIVLKSPQVVRKVHASTWYRMSSEELSTTSASGEENDGWYVGFCTDRQEEVLATTAIVGIEENWHRVNSQKGPYNMSHTCGAQCKETRTFHRLSVVGK